MPGEKRLWLHWENKVLLGLACTTYRSFRLLYTSLDCSGLSQTSLKPPVWTLDSQSCTEDTSLQWKREESLRWLRQEQCIWKKSPLRTQRRMSSHPLAAVRIPRLCCITKLSGASYPPATCKYQEPCTQLAPLKQASWACEGWRWKCPGSSYRMGTE